MVQTSLAVRQGLKHEYSFLTGCIVDQVRDFMAEIGELDTSGASGVALRKQLERILAQLADDLADVQTNTRLASGAWAPEGANDTLKCVLTLLLRKSTSPCHARP